MSLHRQEILRQIPKVDLVLEWPELQPLLARHPRSELLTAVRLILDQLRNKALTHMTTGPPDNADVAARIIAEVNRRSAPSLQSLVNGSGVVIHTNLGRSPLAEEALEAIRTVAEGYSNLEFDLASGARGSRYSHIEHLLCELTGGEAALVVNNNAAAVILAISSIASGREVIVSRGELVEIGGAFRIPDVMRQSGARLVEVGCTNRTHIADYRSAINSETALLLKVHTSNFSIVGFTAEVSPAELSRLGNAADLPVMMDAGSGCLIDLSTYGIPGEPTIRGYLDSGVDIVTFSGDKLLGGPQAGIIVGKKPLIEPMKRHPLLRALRIDKLNLAALEATLRLYRDERLALTAIPTLRMLTAAPSELSRRAKRLLGFLRKGLPDRIKLLRCDGNSSVGGGAFPLLQLPSTLIEVSIDGISPQQLEDALRRSTPPLVGRINHDRFLIDVRTLSEKDFSPLLASLRMALTLLDEKTAHND